MRRLIIGVQLEMVTHSVAEMAGGDLFKGANVCFISERAPVPSKVDNF